MALSWRTTVLADRHRALGSKLEDWNGMGTAWTYNKDVLDRSRGHPHQGRPDGCLRT